MTLLWSQLPNEQFADLRDAHFYGDVTDRWQKPREFGVVAENSVRIDLPEA